MLKQLTESEPEMTRGWKSCSEFKITIIKVLKVLLERVGKYMST